MPSRARWPLLLIPAFGLLLIVAGWIAMLHQLDSERRRILDAEMRDTESFVAAFEQYALRAIKDTDRTALLIKYAFERDGSVDLPRMIAKGLIPVDGLIQVSVTDSAGDVVVSSLDVKGVRNMADREYFRLHAAADTGKLDIGKPIMGRISGRASIPLTRRLNGGDGSFAGIVVLQVDPDYFTAFYRESELGKRGLLGVLGFDGIYRARRSGNEPASTLDAGATTLLARAMTTPMGSFESAGRLDSVVRLMAYRVLRDYPVAVNAAQAKDEVLAEFNARRTVYLAIGAAASIIVLVFFAVVSTLALRLQRSQRRAWEAKEILRAASDSSLDAFFLLRSVRDGAGKVVDFVLRDVNARGADLVGKKRATVVGQRLHLHELLPVAMTGGAIDEYVHVVETGEPLEREFQFNALQTTTPRWFQHQVVRVHDGIAITTRDVTERKRNDEEVHVQKSFLQTLVDNIPLGVLVRSMKAGERGRIVLWNESCEVINGVKATEAVGRTFEDVLPPASAARIAEMDRQLLASPMAQEISDMVLESPMRGKRTLHVIRAPIFDAQNEVEYVVSILRDITVEQARMNEIRLASKVFETTADAIVVSDGDDRVIMVNSAFSRLTGFPPEEIQGQLLAESPFRPTDPADAAARMQRLQQEGHVTGEVVRMRRDGSELPFWITGTCVRDAGGNIINYVRVFTDISQLKEAQQEMQRLASFDTLTGLPNRRLFHDRLEQALERAGRSHHRVGLLFLDLDGFKDVNDTLGHAIGDQLLREVAARLNECVRGSDSLCRLGGDEFTIVVENATLPDDAIRVAERIVGALAPPFLLAGREITTTASIGIAVYPDDGTDSTNLLKNADVAMYRAKKCGRNRFELFSKRTGAWPPPDFRKLRETGPVKLLRCPNPLSSGGEGAVPLPRVAHRPGA